MRIAIAGAGIAGTTAGFLLAERGHDVVLFEQAPHCGPRGAGILLQPSGQAVLKGLGLLEEIAGRSAEISELHAVHASGRTLVRLDYHRMRSRYFERPVGLGVHRGELFTRLLERCRQSGAVVQTGLQVTRCDHGAHGVSLYASPGDGQPETSHGTFDGVIGADGSNSSIRARHFPQARVVEYPYASYWRTGLCDSVTDQLFQVVEGTRQLVGLLPIGAGRCSFFWGARVTDRATLERRGIDAWRQQAVNFCPAAAPLIESTTDFDQLTWSRYRHATVKQTGRGLLVLIGDAAHASSPHLGQGVNLALEDALCLAECLNEEQDFSKAARQYSDLRRAKTRYYQSITHWLTPFFQSDSRWRAPLRDLGLPWMPTLPVIGPLMLRTLSGEKQGWWR